ncbi:hypothetical protein FHS26_001564 [Rhizobium pisi]|uniref:DUF721 domain-containing protein n=1 Tax=Rhizobium pisi TaxID=574561 RepID=A0A3R9BSJ2_9HYPH|nr:DUF721 domain-containing protein [Rhizobium pisi]MBB3133851.1 hypothetical protein [Rhizobium pisi]RSB81905.1 DUF721 domain-containing protein [Rhizobium pisi]TCA50988.1 DUF721 domain-containing protein [Rhizobium pisi]
MSYPRKDVKQISELANRLIDPVLARRAGINTALLGSWSEIAGEDFADCTRPEKIAWARGGDEGSFRPGVLTIACEGARALFLTHAQGELIQRINSFFGFAAVHQIRIVQKPVSQAVRRSRAPAPLKGEAARKLEGMMEGIEGDKLRQAIQRLGTAVMGKRGNQR